MEEGFLVLQEKDGVYNDPETKNKLMGLNWIEQIDWLLSHIIFWYVESKFYINNNGS